VRVVGGGGGWEVWVGWGVLMGGVGGDGSVGMERGGVVLVVGGFGWGEWSFGGWFNGGGGVGG